MKTINRQTAKLFLLVLVVTAAFVFIFRKAIYDTILIPLLYLYWVIDLTLKNIGQTVLWIFLLLIVVVIIFRSLALYRPARPAGESWKSVKMVQGRVISWVNITRDFRKYVSMNTYFMKSLEKLVLAVLSDGQRFTTESPRRSIWDEATGAPEEIRNALESLKLSSEVEELNLFQRLKKAIVALVSSNQAKHQRGSGTELETILTYLEKQLEISHDNDNR